MEIKPNTKEKKYFGKIGLPNLGNICFLNSSIQVINQIFPLSNFFLSDTYLKFINKDNKMGSGGKIVINFAEVLKFLWYDNNVVLTNFEMNNKMKKAYYYDQEKNNEIKEKTSNLLNSIAENNNLYKGYLQHDIIEFLIYFIDILHEDLKIKHKKNQNYNNELQKSMSVNELFKHQWNVFKQNNDSIIVDTFYGMYNIQTICFNCYHSKNVMETFNLITLPIFESEDKLKDEEFQNYNNIISKKKNKNKIYHGKHSFYFCKCTICPYDIKQKIEITIPILSNIYDSIKIKFINEIIFDLLKDKNFIISSPTKDKCDFKSIIIEENTFLYQIFNIPENIELYYIQLENTKLNLDFINHKNFEEIYKKISIFQEEKSSFLSLENKKENENFPENNFLLGEDISYTKNIFDKNFSESNSFNFKGENLSSINKDTNFLNGKSLLKVLSVCFSKNVYNNYQFPKFFLFDLYGDLIGLYKNIFSYFKNYLDLQDNFNNFNNKKTIYFKDLTDDISEIEYLEQKNYNYYLKKDNKLSKNFPFPFVLNFKLGANKKKEYYIPIPITDDLLYNYIEKLKNFISSKNNNYELNEFEIHIIWFEDYFQQLNELEEYIKLNIIIIDPFLDIENRKDENSIQMNKINEMQTLTDLLDNYVGIEKLDSFFCNYCNKKVSVYKNIDFYYLPKVIIFHFQKKVKGYLYKNPIKFPIDEYLDLSKYYKGENHEKKYELISVINFTGNNVSGHYNAYCKHHFEKKWYLFNDIACFIIDDLKKEIIYEDVYAVIYKRIDFNKY